MFNYVVRRVLATIPVMVVVALFVFSLLFIAPGDPAAVIAGDQATPAALSGGRRPGRLAPSRPTRPRGPPPCRMVNPGTCSANIRRPQSGSLQNSLRTVKTSVASGPCSPNSLTWATIPAHCVG